MAAGVERDACADRATVRFCSGEREVEEMPMRTFVLQDAGRGVHIHDHDFRTSVAVEITGGQAARWPWNPKGRAGSISNVLEFAVPQAAVEQGLLQVGIAQLLAFDLRVDVSVGDDQIPPAVVIDVDERDAPTEKLPGPETGLSGDIGEELAVVVVKQGRQIAGKVRFGNVEATITVEIGDRNTHAGLQGSVKVKGNSR